MSFGVERATLPLGLGEPYSFSFLVTRKTSIIVYARLDGITGMANSIHFQRQNSLILDRDSERCD